MLVTTLARHRQVIKDELLGLCPRHWSVELDLRHLKTTTDMDVLRCQTPQMTEQPLCAAICWPTT